MFAEGLPHVYPLGFEVHSQIVIDFFGTADFFVSFLHKGRDPFKVNDSELFGHSAEAGQTDSILELYMLIGFDENLSWIKRKEYCKRGRRRSFEE